MWWENKRARDENTKIWNCDEEKISVGVSQLFYKTNVSFPIYFHLTCMEGERNEWEIDKVYDDEWCDVKEERHKKKKIKLG